MKESNAGTIFVYIIVIILAVTAGVYFLLSVALQNPGTRDTNILAIEKIGPIYRAGDVTVRIASSSLRTRLLRAEVACETDRSSTVQELKKRDPQVQDAVISTLRSKSEEELAPANMGTVKAELISRINEVLPRGRVRNVYFTDFVMQ